MDYLQTLSKLSVKKNTSESEKESESDVKEEIEKGDIKEEEEVDGSAQREIRATKAFVEHEKNDKE